MEGKEFVKKVLGVSRFKNVYEENGYFKRQLSNLEKKNEVHTKDLVECMACLSEELLEKDFDMIEQAEKIFLEESIL